MPRQVRAIPKSRNRCDGRGGQRRDWRRALPVLSGDGVTLRALTRSDAPSLLAHLSDPLVQEYIRPGPASLEGVRRFIRWTQNERRRGLHACYGIVPQGQTKAVGIIQVWAVERDFSTAEWGSVVGHQYWGTGLFVTCARLLVDFAFSTLGARRLEARAVDADARGNGVLRKLGATREGVLRAGFHNGRKLRDHVMWSILSHEWKTRRGPAIERSDTGAHAR